MAFIFGMIQYQLILIFPIKILKFDINYTKQVFLYHNCTKDSKIVDIITKKMSLFIIILSFNHGSHDDLKFMDSYLLGFHFFFSFFNLGNHDYLKLIDTHLLRFYVLKFVDNEREFITSGTPFKSTQYILLYLLVYGFGMTSSAFQLFRKSINTQVC